MKALQILSRTQEITANNLANINTPGFKKDKLFFHALQAKIQGLDMKDPIPHQILNIEPGSLEATGNPFDFAISGDGFFKVNHEGQEFLSRNGRFFVDRDGFLRDENSGFVQGAGGDIFIPQIVDSGLLTAEQIKLEVAKDGSIRLNNEVIDKIQLYKVNDLQQLQRRSNSYITVDDATLIDIDDESAVNQGFYESGNVNALEEMIAMTTNMRLFESQQRLMRTTDEILGRVTNNLGRF